MGRRITVGSPGLTVPYGSTAQRTADAGAGSNRFFGRRRRLSLSIKFIISF